MIENLKIMLAKPSMVENLKSLWKLCFGDSDEYIALFFKERFVPAETMVAVADSTVAAMLFLLPLTICCGKKEYSARYIYAVATHPDYRSQGISGSLLEETHKRLAEQGVALSLLVPAEESLFKYYGKRGFKTEFYCREEEIFADNFAACELKPVLLQDMLNLRNSIFAQSSMFARWDISALAYQQKETELLGGETLGLLSPNRGYAVCCPTEDSVLIKEWAAKKVDPLTAAAIAQRYGKKRTVLRLAADANDLNAIPFAMTKWYISEREPSSGSAPYISLVLD